MVVTNTEGTLKLLETRKVKGTTRRAVKLGDEGEEWQKTSFKKSVRGRNQTELPITTCISSTKRSS